MFIRVSRLLLFVFALVPMAALAKANCPDAVVHATQGQYPQSRITSCKEEQEKGSTQYDVKVSTRDAKVVELDVSPQGTILLTEERVDPKSLPVTVTSAFAAKYSSAKVISAERQIKGDGSITYELGFKVNGKKHEATFDQGGSFQGEE